jgi:hypothetical protein
MKTTLVLLLAAPLLCLANASEARAWGAYHAGYTYHSPGGGFTHSSANSFSGPYGEHTGSRSTSYNPYTGFSHTGSGQTSGAYGGSAYHSSSAYGGYGGYHGGYVGAYGGSAAYAGAYRRW